MSSWTLLSVEQVNDTVVVSLIPSDLFCDSKIERFGRELLAISTNTADTDLLLDLSTLASAPSSVFSVMMMAKKQLLSTGGNLFLCDLQDTFRESLRILNLEGNVFEVFDTQEGAVKELRRRKAG